MAVEFKKKIIMPKELIEAPLGAFFRELGWELLETADENSLKTCEFICNDHLPEIIDFPRIKTNPLLSFPPEIEKNIRGIFDEKQLENVHVKTLLKTQFDNGPAQDFIERYSKNIRQVFMLKIHEALNVGYFIDSMVIEAYKAKLDHERIRSYLNEFIAYCLKCIEYNENQKFIEVAYSLNDQVFALQVNFDCKDFALDFEMEKFKAFRGKTNYFDVNFFSKRKRLTISSLWFKDITLKKFHSYFYNETTTRVLEATTLQIKSGLEPKEEVQYIPPARDQGKKLALARKFALFIKNYRQREEAPKPSDELELVDVENYMTFYPRQEALAELDDELKHFILKLLKNENLYDGISDVVKRIADSGLEDYSTEIQKIIAGKSLKDLEETLTIHGKKEDLGEGFTRVKGAPEEQDNQKQIVQDVTQNLTNDEKWEIKKALISEKIDEEISRIKSDGRNILKDDIIKVVSTQLDVNEEDVKLIVQGIIEEAVAPLVVTDEIIASELTSLETIVKSDSDAVKEKLESQIFRMKKVMEQMKQEMVKLRNENLMNPAGEIGSGTTIVKTDILRLKNALARTMTALKGKEKLIEKLRHDHELILENKAMRIKELEERIEGIKADFAISSEQISAEKMILLESENKNLHSKLDMANRKISTINENIDNRTNELHVKKDRELATLKTSVQMAQALIERFKNEKVDLEIKLVAEKEGAKKIRDELEGKLKSIYGEDPDKVAGDIQALTADKRSLEEKYKLQGMELKRLEQKLKFTTSQLESAQKKKNGPSTAQKSNDAYLKQLESANHRLAEAGAEIGDKKKEILKLKQENTVLTGKITELERKLAMADKKAA